MKNIVLSAIAVFAMSSFAIAGGDITPPEEPMVDVPEVMEVEVVDQGFYAGLAYANLNAEATRSADAFGLKIEENLFDESFTDIMFQAGYKFNQYVAVEGRYWAGVESTIDWGVADNFGVLYSTDMSIDAWGLYVKPMYPVTPEFDVYALLGYGSAEYDLTDKAGNVSIKYNSESLDSFSWGLGVSYTFNENIIIFADYVSIYDDSSDTIIEDFYDVTYDDTIDTINIGVAYQF